MRRCTWILACVLSGAAAVALAHSNDYLDSTPAPHGGQVRMAGALHLELVVEPQTLVVHVTDHGGSAIATQGGSAKAIITSGKQRYVVILKPAGENQLRGSGDFKLGRYNAIQLMVALPDQPVARADFVYPKGAQRPKGKRASATHTGTANSR